MTIPKQICLHSQRALNGLRAQAGVARTRIELGGNCTRSMPIYAPSSRRRGDDNGSSLLCLHSLPRDPVDQMLGRESLIRTTITTSLHRPGDESEWLCLPLYAIPPPFDWQYQPLPQTSFPKTLLAT